jgi:RNA polymerase sigma factor (sigma-70 family)
VHVIDETPAVRQWDEANSFEDVFREHFAVINRIVQRILGDAGRAEEIAAEAFVKLLLRPKLLFLNQNIVGWLYRTASNAALDELRRNKLRLASEKQVDAPRPLDPYELVESAEQNARVRSVLRRLRRREVQLLVARSMDLSYAEIAIIVGVQRSSVGALLARAEAAFGREYNDQFRKS